MAKRTDFDDEDEVLREIAKEIDIPADELRIKEDRGLAGFGVGTVYEITLRGGHKEWCVVEDSDVERQLALAIVTQDLEQEPEIFNKSFLESQIDEKKLRDELRSDVYDSNYDMCQDEAGHNPSDFWNRYESAGFEAPEEDEDGERRDPKDDEIDELAESLTKEQLRDPMGYLEDIYGKEEAAAKALEIVGFDVEKAAEEAVDTDGAAHFLSTYDGNTNESSSGFVYWRRN